MIVPEGIPAVSGEEALQGSGEVSTGEMSTGEIMTGEEIVEGYFDRAYDK